MAKAVKKFDQSWKNWVRENLERGSSPGEMVRILKSHGFAEKTIRQAMGKSFPDFVAKGKELDESWRNWVSLNLERGCDPQGIEKILRDNGFAADSINKAMGRKSRFDWLRRKKSQALASIISPCPGAGSRSPATG